MCRGRPATRTQAPQASCRGAPTSSATSASRASTWHTVRTKASAGVPRSASLRCEPASVGKAWLGLPSWGPIVLLMCFTCGGDRRQRGSEGSRHAGGAEVRAQLCGTFLRLERAAGAPPSPAATWPMGRSRATPSSATQPAPRLPPPRRARPAAARADAPVRGGSQRSSKPRCHGPQGRLPTAAGRYRRDTRQRQAGEPQRGSICTARLRAALSGAFHPLRLHACPPRQPHKLGNGSHECVVHSRGQVVLQVAAGKGWGGAGGSGGGSKGCHRIPRGYCVRRRCVGSGAPDGQLGVEVNPAPRNNAML